MKTQLRVLLALAFFAGSVPVWAQPTTTISALPAVTAPLTDQELAPVVQSGATKKATVAQIKVAYQGTSAPISPILGQFWFDTTTSPALVLKQYDGASWVTWGTLNTSAHTWTPATGAGCTFANPTATIGATAVNGSATTCMRSDAAPALPSTLPALSGVNLTNLNGSNIGSGTVPSARLPAGKSVADPGTGFLENLLPPQTVTGASKTFTTADLQLETRRSNSGSAMTDTFPASSATGLANGAQITVNNVDTTGTDTITAGAGTTFSGGSTDVIEPGRSVRYVYDLGSTTWRKTLNSGSDAVLSATGTNVVGHIVTMASIYAKVQDSGIALSSVATGATNGILKGDGAGNVAAVTIGSGLSYSGGTLSATGSGGNTTITPATGNIAGDILCMNNTTTSIQDCGYSASAIPSNKLTAALDAQTGTTYTIPTSSGGKIISANNAASVAFTLPAAATLGSGWGADVFNKGAGALTTTLASGNFDNGATSISTVTGQDLFTWSDGSAVHSSLSLPVMAQDTLLGNPNASNYPTAMAIPACANDGAHGLVYASHALACASITGGGGSGTVNSGTAGSGAYYAATTNAVSDASAAQVTFGGIVINSGTSVTNGFRLKAANNPEVMASSAEVMAWGTSGTTGFKAIFDTNAAGYQINTGAMTGTACAFIPNRGSTNTCFSAQASGNLEALVNGTEMVRWTSAGLLVQNGVVGLKSYTVSTLPGSPATGYLAVVTDANAACSFGATPAGSGSTVCKVWYNGTGWVEGFFFLFPAIPARRRRLLVANDQEKIAA